MPIIYDNIDRKLLDDGLNKALTGARRADFCVGYFNLRGWRMILPAVKTLQGEEGYPHCRLIVGMVAKPEDQVRRYYSRTEKKITLGKVKELRDNLLVNFAKQLTQGFPTADDEWALQDLAKQLREKRLAVKFFARHSLHAKLYLAHHAGGDIATTGFVGSSNLTFSGFERNIELNVDIVERDAAKELAEWFEKRWEDEWCLDVSDELADIIENSWAGGPVMPYHIYIKTAYHLSREAIEGARRFRLPPEFANKMLEFQVQAVAMAAQRLNRQRGVIIGDVVGLGKTRVASAVAKTFQDDRGDNVLVVCPPKLEKMWKDYLHDFRIAGDTLSLGSVHQLKDMRRYRLIIVDESHNFRNRDSKRFAHLRDYIKDNESRVILLTATPYNKAFTDIGNQLRLFLDPSEDLGIRPDAVIRDQSGVVEFKREHPNVLLTSLAAFERSEKLDDWRELMRIFMVRRTRTHIKKNYADFDEEKNRHYLTLPTGERFYFPHRQPRHVSFSLKKGDDKDQYARLYSRFVVDIIGTLILPRYGLKPYLKEDAKSTANEREQKIMTNLTRAGGRLRGFMRVGLFKRLESSGPSFLLSVKRHILRNTVMLHALKIGGDILIGQAEGSFTDDVLEDNDLFPDNIIPEDLTLKSFLIAGEKLYEALKQGGKLKPLRADLFENTLAGDLAADCENLLTVLKLAPEWDAANDRKLKALADLCLKTHGSEKILIFTQFTDTAKYLHKELAAQGVKDLEVAHGNVENLTPIVARFSPRSNDTKPKGSEIRVLVATDVLSEGQNLQDAHIIVNFDLPWAIIRLVQRAGRVDRIGQHAETVYCYSALPEDSIEDIINLRGRLRSRMRENEELVGSDERFFEDDPKAETLRMVYEDKINLDEDDDETDLITRAYDIWNQAIKNNPELENFIANMANVVYSAKATDDKKIAGDVITYVKDSRKRHILAQVDKHGEVVSQSQSRLLDMLACEPDTPRARPALYHHELATKAAIYLRQISSDLIGGQLGGESSVRRRVYDKLKLVLQQEEDTLLARSELKEAVNLIYKWPLREAAHQSFRRQLQMDIDNLGLADMAIDFYRMDNLCQMSEEKEPASGAEIICSMGLVE